MDEMFETDWDDEANLTTLAESAYSTITTTGWPGRSGFPYLNDNQFHIVADMVKKWISDDREDLMNNATNKTHLNPTASFELVQEGAYETVVVNLLDEDTMEVIASFPFDDSPLLEGVKDIFWKASQSLALMQAEGYDKAAEMQGLIVNDIERPGFLVDQDLTVEDILGASEE